MKILDSDHCVALLRGQLDLRAFAAPDERLAITTISVAELSHGAHKSARRSDNLARLDVLFASVEILPFDAGAARRFGLLKANLERQGNIIADLDLQIACIAIDRRLTLVTHNQRHFQRVPDLTLEDWIP